jgi:hypothetical protein
MERESDGSDSPASPVRREPKHKHDSPSPSQAQAQSAPPPRPKSNGVHRGRQKQKHPTPTPTQSEAINMNGNGGHVMNGNGHPQQSDEQSNTAYMNGNVERLALSTTDGASVPSLTNRKLIKIRLNPGEKSAKPLMVTVAIDASTSRDLGDMHDLSLGVGQKVQLQHTENDKGVKTLEISFQPSTINETIPWEPPLVLYGEEAEMPDVDATKQKEQPSDTTSLRLTTASSNEAALHDDIVPEQQSTPAVPSRFAVNTSTVAAEVAVPKPAKHISPSVKSLEPFVIPSILTPTIEKLAPTEKVGIAFRKADDVVIIEKIVPGSLAEGAYLSPGYECLAINGHRLRSARRAAELVRESEKSLTMVVSNAPRPPGTLYTMVSLKDQSESGKDFALGMHFKMRHGLVKLVHVDPNSPILATSMKVGDVILAISGSAIESVPKAVEALSNINDDCVVPILYFSLRQLRVSLVEKAIGDLCKKEWSNGYNECVILQPGHNSLIPWTLRFKDDGMCTLIDSMRAFRRISAGTSTTSSVPPALHLVVENINHGIVSALSAIRAGVELVASKESREVNQEHEKDAVV